MIRTIDTLQGTITYPPKNGILKSMIFPTSRLVGYVSIPWRVMHQVVEKFHLDELRPSTPSFFSHTIHAY